MGQLDKYLMKIDDFDTNFISLLSLLKDSEDLFDVTLVSDDEIPIQAHKVVLSVSSPFFRNVLKFNKNPSPLLYIRGVTNTVLGNVVEFLYKGEATVAENDLDDFLKLSKDLKLTGLSENDDSVSSPVVEEEKVKHTNRKMTSQKENIKKDKKENQRPQKSKNVDDTIDFIYDLDIVDPVHDSANSPIVQNVENQTNQKFALQNKNIKKEKTENQGLQKSNAFDENDDPKSKFPEIKDNTELDAKILEMMEKKDNMWHCKGCGVSKTKKSNMQVHIEINHMNAPQPCSFCDIVSKNRPGLSLHVKKYHSNK